MHLINACEVINHRCECESLTDICRYSITEHYLHIVAFALQGLIGHSPLSPLGDRRCQVSPQALKSTGTSRLPGPESPST